MSTQFATTHGVQTGSLRDFVVLAKPRISVMVLFTVAVGGLISAGETASLGKLIHSMIGLLLVSASGCAINQYLERYVDWMMPRTAKRPLPDQRLTSVQVAAFGSIALGCGMAYLIALVNWQTAVVAGASWVIYCLIYTPLKAHSWLNTYVGAIAGAMPVLVGSTAIANGQLTTAAILLFAVLYIWQFPHFMAIAWLYREDYEKGNLKMVTTGDVGGRRTAGHAVFFAIILLPVVAVSMWSTSLLGLALLTCAEVLGVWYLWASIGFARETDDTTARRLFRVSLLFLPCYLVLLSIGVLT